MSKSSPTHPAWCIACLLCISAPAAPLPAPIDLAVAGRPLTFSVTLRHTAGKAGLTLDGSRHLTKPVVIGINEARQPFITVKSQTVHANRPVDRGMIRILGRIEAHPGKPGSIRILAMPAAEAPPEKPPAADAWTVAQTRVPGNLVLEEYFLDVVNDAKANFSDIRFGTHWEDIAGGVTALTGGTGRFGRCIETETVLAEARPEPLYDRTTLTVEAWVRLRFEKTYNIIAAHGPKSFAGHWELYSEAANGAFAVYIPGNRPAVIRSTVIITDQRWHHVSMAIGTADIVLTVDGREAARVANTRPPVDTPGRWGMTIGALRERSLRCSGQIDEVCITAGQRISEKSPEKTRRLDGKTLRLWHLDVEKEGWSPGATAPNDRTHGLELHASKSDLAYPTVRRRIEPAVRPFTMTRTANALDHFSLPGLLLRHIRPGVLADWGEQYEELQLQIEGRIRPPEGAARTVLDAHALIRETEKTPAAVVLRRTRALLDHLGQQAGAPAADAWTRDALSRIETGNLADDAAYLAACAVRRRLVFSNPLLDFDRLLFVARGTYAGSRLTTLRNRDAEGGHFVNQYFGFNSIPAGGLYIVEDFRGTPKVVDLLAAAETASDEWGAGTLTRGATAMPDLHWDGERILFAHCAAQTHSWHTWSRQTTWNLFSLKSDGTDLRQLTDSAWNDFDPCWLPDGRIAFISERRGGYIRCFGSYINVPNYVLHAMSADGSGIRPLSVYETSEWNPSVDNHGMIVYTRWDYTDRENCLGSNFWICYPDGRNPRAPHGNYPYPWHTFPEPPAALSFHTTRDTRRGRPMTEMGIRAVPNSSRYMLTAAPHHGEAFGALCLLDLSGPDDGGMSQLKRITPYVPFPESESGPRSQYRFGTPWPLSDDVYLCNSWENLYILDRFGNLELLCERALLPCVQDDRLRLTDPIPIRARPRPPVIPPMARTTASGVPAAQTARVTIINVADTDIPLPDGVRIRHLRILQNFLKTNHTMGQPLGGYQVENVPRMSLGTVPVAADGSVYFHAPPGKQLIFQLLDQDYMAVHSMRSVAYVQPGENLSCMGCHEQAHDTPKAAGRIARAVRESPAVPLPEIGPLEPVSYYRHIRPLVEDVCTACHRPSGKGPTDMSYEGLKPLTFHFAGGMAWSTSKPMHGGSRTIPGHMGARASRLGQAILKHRRDKRVSERAYRTIVLWLDANCPRLTALYREQDQIAGGLVWPKLDVDPADPLGLEGDPGENTPERIEARAALWHPAGPERLSGYAHRFVVSDHTANRVVIVGRDGRIEWHYNCDHPQDVWMLDNGMVLVAWYRAAQLIDPHLKTGEGGRIVWEYRVDAPAEIPCCQPLADGNFLVGVCGPCELLEIDPHGQVRKRVKIPKPKGSLHAQFRFCRKTPSGTYLVPFLGAGKVTEFDADGAVLRRFDWSGPAVSAERLPNGHTLIGGGGLVREFAADGSLLWQLDSDDMEDTDLKMVAGVERLANGNTLITNWGVKAGNRTTPQILEITPEKWIVWRVWDNPALGSLAQTRILDPPISMQP